ncbi:MAG: helix-turn-helix domain-containing protein [Myxococcota bacterium]
MDFETPAGAPFGGQLRYWRQVKGLSQLELAHRAETTPRHLSFIETGRSRPGRDVVLRIAECLELPMRARNDLLQAAGLPPAYPERDLDDDALAPFIDGIRALLEAHAPNPAAAFDELGRVRLANATYRRLSPGVEERTPEEIVDLFYGEVGRGLVVNWAEVAWMTAQRRLRNAIASGSAEQLRLAERARALVAEVAQPDMTGSEASPLICPRLRVGAEVVETYSVVVRFETAQDVTLSELRVELTYPTDAAGAEVFRKLGDEPP